MGITNAPHVESLPEKLRPAAALWFERLAEQGLQIPDDLIHSAARLIACSEFAGRVLLREFSWFIENVASFSDPPDDVELNRFVDAIASSDADSAAVKSEFRRFRNRFLLRVLWREVLQQAELAETLRQLSLLADRLLDAATQYGIKQLQPRFGQVRNSAGQIVPMVILGMGKLGGRELNFSSDIDIIFCYPEGGETDGQRKTSAQEYFARLSRQVIALIDEVTVDGFAFRIDTRLRPFGDSGPPVVSFAAMESYLLQHGRDWERPLCLPALSGLRRLRVSSGNAGNDCKRSPSSGAGRQHKTRSWRDSRSRIYRAGAATRSRRQRASIAESRAAKSPADAGQ
jgi:glutamate-ammonia-ligase adenylyltransferase